MSSSSNSSYSQILKSTSLIGFSSILNIAVGIVRSKVMASMLGPGGVGLNGLYTSITTLAEAIAGMGVNSSGVRQIAEAAGTSDEAKVAKTAAVLRKTSLLLGMAGAAGVAVFARQISVATFGTADQTWAVLLLAVTVFLRVVSLGQGALMQGLRRISDIAKAGVIGTVAATAATIPLIYWFRETGVAISVVAGAAVSLVVSWWFSRQANVERIRVSFRDVRGEVKELLHLGSAMMVSSLAMMGSAYLIRAWIQQELGLEATGLYQAAYSLGGMYVGFILQSMGSDFYPRLTAVIHDHEACNRVVNEQARISLLLAGAGIIGTVTFAPWVVNVFYAQGFGESVNVLRWICLGTALQVVSWPMGYIIVAKGQKNMLILTELSWAAVHLALAWFGMQWFGLIGTGFAFFAAYIFHIAMVWILTARLTGFSWSAECRNAVLTYLFLIGSVVGAVYIRPAVWAMALGTVVMLAYGYSSIATIMSLVPADQLPGPLRKFMGHTQGMFWMLRRSES